jgi:hypothetical protein
VEKENFSIFFEKNVSFRRFEQDRSSISVDLSIFVSRMKGQRENMYIILKVKKNFIKKIYKSKKFNLVFRFQKIENTGFCNTWS